jgi:hypothetical protein
MFAGGQGMAGYMPGKTIPLRSIVLSMADIERIFDRLLEQVQNEPNRIIDTIAKPENKTDEEFEQDMAALRARAFRITITISGRDGEELFGDTGDLFRSPNLPHVVSAVYMTNVVAFEGEARVRPSNAFELLLDFSKPPLLDGMNPVSAPTPNNSNLRIQGENEAWIAAVSAAVLGITDRRGTRRAWLHAPFVYDFGALLLGLPAGLYIAYRLSGPIETYLGSVHGFLSAAAYLYAILVTLWGYRIFFGYTKWAFPSVEMRNPEDAASKHRGFWYLIVVGLIGQALWQLFY